jgi:pyruvate,water dikinase
MLRKVDGGAAVAEAIEAYLENYGMRCPGEIDVTAPGPDHQRPEGTGGHHASLAPNFRPGHHVTGIGETS